MKRSKPLEVVQELMERGLDRSLAQPVRRELRKARAEGILQGLTATLRPGDVCIDCGAHIGDVALPLAATGAEVHAFEPEPRFFQKLADASADTPNLIVHQAAVGIKNGEARFFRSTAASKRPAKRATGGTLVAQSAVADEDSAVTVPVVDLAGYIEKLLHNHDRLAFMKIDVEGAEIDIVNHLVDAGVLPRIGLTVVETHRWLMKSRAAEFDRLNEIARKQPELNLFMGWI